MSSQLPREETIANRARDETLPQLQIEIKEEAIEAMGKPLTNVIDARFFFALGFEFAVSN